MHKIVNEMAGELHSVPHEEINRLLEVLKERRYKYNADLPIFKGLNKQAKMLFGGKFES